jgi:malonyl-CoA/methylmalonyl-CoA synthetase
MQKCLDPSQILISSDAYVDLNKSGLVIFTSGTTGPPKGGVKRRGFFYEVASSFSDLHGIREGDRVLHVLPVHHATGVTVTLIPFLYCGGCIEFRSGGFDVEWTWERIRQGGLAFFSGVPTIYMRLMSFYEQRLTKLAPQDLQHYIKGINEFRVLLCGTSALPRPLQQKWSRLRAGRIILTRYGGTEFGNVFTVTPWAEDVPDGSVGEKAPGADFKLSSGDEGEVLVRSPIMFSKYGNYLVQWTLANHRRYLFDEEATRNALDGDGYFKTGDIARREGKHYFILGRASIDSEPAQVACTAVPAKFVSQ